MLLYFEAFMEVVSNVFVIHDNVVGVLQFTGVSVEIQVDSWICYSSDVDYGVITCNGVMKHFNRVQLS